MFRERPLLYLDVTYFLIGQLLPYRIAAPRDVTALIQSSLFILPIRALNLVEYLADNLLVFMLLASAS